MTRRQARRLHARAQTWRVQRHGSLWGITLPENNNELQELLKIMRQLTEAMP